MTSSTRKENAVVKIITDIFILFLLLSYYVIAQFYFPPFHRGYFCDDESIMYPHKKITISVPVLLCMVNFIPITLIIFTEVFWNNNRAIYSKMSKSDFLSREMPHKSQLIYRTVVTFFFGLLTTLVSTNFIKLLSGRLRPAFLELCKPDFNCSSVGNPHYYVETYTCTNPDYSENDRQLRLSFPSGHSSLSAYSMLFASLYLQKRVHFKYSFLLKPIMQFLLLLLAAFICLTRIGENQHHVADVIGGVVIGLTVSLIVVFVQSGLFKTGSHDFLPEEKRTILSF